MILLFMHKYAFGALRGESPAEGVVAYFSKTEMCCDTSLFSENSRVGGDFPRQLIFMHIKHRQKRAFEG